MVRAHQQLLPLSHVLNRGLFSNHWFENRLPLEPEWDELREQARSTLDALAVLWERERGRVERYGTEAPLEHAFIQPVFETLGWKLIYQTFLQSRKPDYALFLDDEALDAALAVERTSPDFWRTPIVVADAKAWHIPLNRPSVVNNQREYPPQQIEWYLDRSRLDFGILTTGGLWRLVPREHSPQQRRFQTYLECDLAGLLEAWRNARPAGRQSQRVITERDALVEEFLKFFLFFSPAAYQETERLKPLIHRAIEGSSEYRVGVGEGLKERAFDALRLCIEGFLNCPSNDLSADVDLERCRKESFVLLYRLLFIMYAEDRRLLPYRTNRTYTDNRSLGRHRDEIAGRLDRIRDDVEDDFSRESTDIWEDLRSLFDLVDGGHRRYGVPAYNGGLFAPEAHPFLKNKRMSDYYLARVIDQLGRAKDPMHMAAGLSRIDYRDLAIQHLGGIYEGLLELRPTLALDNMVVISKRVQGRLEERYLPESEPLPRGWKVTERRYRRGTIYLQTDKGERRASGSYYTPDHIVNYIVSHTLGPLCTAVSDQLKAEIGKEQGRLETTSGDSRSKHEARLEALRADFDDRILRLRVLDPAMGSGHFLIRACQWLAEEIATHPFTGDENAAGMAECESAVSYWKRRVVESCLYGVDMNGLAVELAKLALWLETVAGDEPLSFLNHHLHYGNSLVGGKIANTGVLPGEIELRANNFRQQVEEKMPALLGSLARISEIPSDTAEHIKDKDRLYSEFEKARKPYRLVGDLWCSAFCADSQITPEHYQRAVEELGRPRRFARLTEDEWFQRSLDAANKEFTRCFHWELEFPEVFFEGTVRRANPGFDAVIGNPPYDVLSERESGRDLAAFRAFIEHEPAYEPSRTGKNNLYKLFICQSLELLADKGYFGFITPMAILGDKITASIRQQIITVASFTGVDAFPQKDNPADRVFSEAKLSTAVYTLKRYTTDRQAFRVRVHSGRLIKENSPSYTLSTADIPLYDPVNFTIVSCSQADWDLATRIMRTGRMVRLSEIAEFFQGEVNETNERKRGNLIEDPDRGELVTRGASICLYVTRPASQGHDLNLDVERFLEGKAEDTKAFHHRYRRVCWQESSPQNNFRRVIAALVPQGEFCNHTINYLPEHTSRQPLEFVLGLLNSKLIDWYFRLGSTNAHVSHYQAGNLPCPQFDEGEPNAKVVDNVQRLIRSGKLEDAFQLLAADLNEAPFSPAIRIAIVEAVNRIIDVENSRGIIRRVDRSALDPHAQPYQDFIDRLLYAMAGLTDAEARGLESRLAEMM